MSALRSAVLILMLLISAALAATALKPRDEVTAAATPVVLAAEIPVRFQDWHDDEGASVVVPDPGIAAQLSAVYSDTLSRTYIDGAGRRVMLSIAYGSDQSSEATQAHRPEFCYTAQGFLLSALPAGEVDLGAKRIAVRRLIGVRGERYEPISYWLMMDGQTTLPGLNRKWLQFQYRLRGRIPDGMIVRVSTLGSDAAQSFALQDAFLKALYTGLNGSVRGRYFGT